jgi:hypothetical protein
MRNSLKKNASHVSGDSASDTRGLLLVLKILDFFFGSGCARTAEWLFTVMML